MVGNLLFSHFSGFKNKPKTRKTRSGGTLSMGTKLFQFPSFLPPLEDTIEFSVARLTVVRAVEVPPSPGTCSTSRVSYLPCVFSLYCVLAVRYFRLSLSLRRSRVFCYNIGLFACWYYCIMVTSSFRLFFFFTGNFLRCFHRTVSGYMRVGCMRQ